jgi:hypothetical protein
MTSATIRGARRHAFEDRHYLLTPLLRQSNLAHRAASLRECAGSLDYLGKRP